MPTPNYLEGIDVPLPDYVESAKAFTEKDLQKNIMAVSALLSRVDWDPAAFVPTESWFLGTYLVAMIQEQGLRHPEDSSSLASLAEQAEAFRRGVTESFRGYPDWFGNNQEVHRPHRQRLMERDYAYRTNPVRDYRSVEVSWFDELANPF